VIRRLIRNFLGSKPSYEVCGEAVDGVDAVEKATELKAHLIILDLSMPREVLDRKDVRRKLDEVLLTYRRGPDG
jgi:DNA-binding NarL/FixJ family response regulator